MNRKKIIVAKSAGFCWGVRRAFNKVLEMAKSEDRKEPLFTYGPLIHNPQAVQFLEEKGVSVLEEITPGMEGTIFIRTHGLSPKERALLKKTRAKVCDATCPDVGVIQGIVRKYLRQGYFIVIVGNNEHPEVKALLGYAEGSGVAVASREEVPGLPDGCEKVCVVAQSTQKEDKFEEIVEELKKKYPQCKVFNTICKSTTLRQKEVQRLAKKVDAMVVVGGYNSANTTKLAQISKETGTPTFHVETEEGLNAEDFKAFKVIGVTAGSSTPSWMIERVVNRLKSF